MSAITRWRALTLQNGQKAQQKDSDFLKAGGGVSVAGISTATRDALTGQVEPDTIYNSTTHQYEYWNGSYWAAVAPSAVDTIEVWVDPAAGNDDNTGISAEPFQTLGRALKAFRTPWNFHAIIHLLATGTYTLDGGINGLPAQVDTIAIPGSSCRGASPLVIIGDTPTDSGLGIITADAGGAAGNFLTHSTFGTHTTIGATNLWQGWLIEWLTGANAGSFYFIDTHSTSAGLTTFTVAGAANAIVSGTDTFRIVRPTTVIDISFLLLIAGPGSTLIFQNVWFHKASASYVAMLVSGCRVLFQACWAGTSSDFIEIGTGFDGDCVFGSNELYANNQDRVVNYGASPNFGDVPGMYITAASEEGYLLVGNGTFQITNSILVNTTAPIQTTGVLNFTTSYLTGSSSFTAQSTATQTFNSCVFDTMSIVPFDTISGGCFNFDGSSRGLFNYCVFNNCGTVGQTAVIAITGNATVIAGHCSSTVNNILIPFWVFQNANLKLFSGMTAAGPVAGQHVAIDNELYVSYTFCQIQGLTTGRYGSVITFNNVSGPLSSQLGYEIGQNVVEGATISPLPSYTVTNAGMTLVGVSGSFPGVDNSIGNYNQATILVKDEVGANAINNGIWCVASAAAPWQLQRLSALPINRHAAGCSIFINQGTTNGNTGWLCNSVYGSDVVGVDNLTFQKIIGNYFLAAAEYSGHSTRTGLVTDYLVPITSTAGAVTYQAIAMGSTATSRAQLIIKDESYSGAYGSPLAHPITFQPVSGKKLDNVVNGTAVISNGGGRWWGEEDENNNWHTILLVP